MGISSNDSVEDTFNGIFVHDDSFLGDLIRSTLSCYINRVWEHNFMGENVDGNNSSRIAAL